MTLHSSPFASALSAQPRRSAAGAYAQVRAQSAMAGADAHRLVAMLFDGLNDTLNEAMGAMTRGDVAAKCDALSRAARIVDEGLKAGLDLKAGGEVAQSLSLLYDYMSMTLTKANLKSDSALVAEVQRLLEPVRDAWKRIATNGRSVN